MKNSTVIILLLLSVGLFYTFTNVQYREAKVLHNVASDYQNVLRNATAIAALRDQLLISYEAFPKAELDRINKVLPDNLDTVRLALDLDTVASRQGVAIKSIRVSVGSSKTDGVVVLPEYASLYDKATISFSFVSTYESFMRLLADLERNLRIMDVKSVSFQASESDLYDYQVSMETYWLK